MKNFEQYGIKVPEVLLPKKSVDLKAWSVVACDQYTQDRDYWKRVSDFVQEKPSTLHITFPEVYLQDDDKKDRIQKIRSTMATYCQSNEVFEDAFSGMIYLERTTEYGRVRKGLVTAIDLETYEWKPFAQSLIRATEATIVDRIPPRMEIRNGAPLELPHIMLLVDDKKGLLVEALGKKVKESQANVLYDTDLMENAGHITGWGIAQDEELQAVSEALAVLAKENTQKDGSVFLFAVGDGNHSLATAKAVWEEVKKTAGSSDGSIPASVEHHAARYALIEIVSIYDEGLTFEPIHRVLFNAHAEDLLGNLKEKLSATIENCDSQETLENLVKNSKSNFGFVYEKNGEICYTCLKASLSGLAVSFLQPALDSFIKDSSKEIEIDYIHGSEEVFRLGGNKGVISILLPPIEKNSFFATISQNGPLPRKSFSMGEASEKRFYMECRKLFS
ncbi:MAG: DUF1015 domain-containing protein [Spirochaetaceae bacterium]|nr:DUF1015 domain-containing protein [Spirochaetaceae bacterium]